MSALEWGPKEDRAFAGTYDGDIYEINTQSEVCCSSLLTLIVQCKLVNMKSLGACLMNNDTGCQPGHG